MNSFDLLINIIESFTTLIIVNLVYQKKEYLKLIIFTIISFFFITYANIYSIDNYLYRIIDYIIIFLYATSITHKLDIKNIFIALISTAMLDIATVIVYLIYDFINQNLCILDFNMYIITSRIAYFILNYFASTFIKNSHYFNPKLMALSNLSLIILGLLFGLYIDKIFINIEPNIYLIILLIFILFMNIILLFNESRKDAKKLYEKQLHLNILEEKKNNYLLSKESIEKTNTLKHNLAYIYNSVIYEINHGNYQNALNILTKQIKELENINKIIVTGNDIVDYCIALQSNKINKLKIRVISDALPDDIPINNEDLFIIFGNLFQNAVENCQPNPDRHILVSAGMINNFFYLKIKNTISSSVLTHNPNLYTSKYKQAIHGIGISTCKNIIHKYDGELLFDEDIMFFNAKVIIPIK